MNLNKLYSATQNSTFTDLKLTLVDELTKNEMKINVHKIILWSSSTYFENLLTKLVEKDYTQITIEVPNIYASYDIIMSFYGQETNVGNLPKWKHLLELIKCYEFFLLEFNYSLIYNLKVPTEGFKLLLEILHLLEDNDKIYKLIEMNIPEDYDRSMLSDELIDKLSKIKDCYYIAFKTDDDEIKIWDIEDNKLVCVLTGDFDHVCSLNKNVIAIDNANDYIIKIWDIQTGNLISTFEEYNISCTCISPDSSMIAFGNSEGNISIWNIQRSELIHVLSGRKIVLSISFSPDNKSIVSANVDTIKIWNVQDGNLVHTLDGHKSWITHVSFSPDNSLIASGSDDHTIKIWNAKNGLLIRTLRGYEHGTGNILFSSDNNLITSGNINGEIYVWNMQNDNPIHTLVCSHKNTIKNIWFSQDNNIIVSGDCNGIINFWNINNGDLIRTLEFTANKSFAYYNLNY